MGHWIVSCEASSGCYQVTVGMNPPQEDGLDLGGQVSCGMDNAWHGKYHVDRKECNSLTAASEVMQMFAVTHLR